MSHQVVTIHDVASIDHPEWFGARFAMWYRWAMPLLTRRVDRVITVSQFSRNRLLELTGLPNSHFVVIPNGVDDRFHPRFADEIAGIKKKYDISSEGYFLSVSSLEPRKNLRHLLNAWQLSLSRLPSSVWLVIAGVKGRKNIFHACHVETIPSRVLFTGFVDDEDLPGLYSGALALLYPSMYEGFGLPVLESMASGTVPIVSDSTALPEVIGNEGILVNPFVLEELADAIVRVADDSDLRSELSRRGIQRSREFTWERAAERTWEVLSEELQGQ